MTDLCEELRFVRAFSPDVIPKYLVEQIKDRDFSVEDFYRFQSLNCLHDTKEGQTLNPLNHLYAMANDKNEVKGFVWMIVDPLSKDLVINNYSVDQEYWRKGKAVKKLVDFVKKLMEKCAIDRVYWITRYPKHSERHAFKRSKNILMEYKYGQDTDGLDKAKKERRTSGTGTEAGSKPDGN